MIWDRGSGRKAVILQARYKSNSNDRCLIEFNWIAGFHFVQEGEK